MALIQKVTQLSRPGSLDMRSDPVAAWPGQLPELAPSGRYQSAIGMLARRAIRETKLSLILDEACRLCAETLQAPFCKILEFRSPKGDLLVRAGFGWRSGIVGRAIALDRKNPAGKAFTDRRTVAEDIACDDRHEMPALYWQHEIVSTLNAPIQGESEPPFGVLAVACPEARVFAPAEIAFLEAFAGILAEAVDRSARMDGVQAAQAEKAELAEQRGVFLRELQHRVRNDLQLVQSLATIEARRAADPSAKAGFDTIGRRVMSLATLYDHLLGVGMERWVDFGEYLASLCAKISLAEGFESRGIKLVTDLQSLALDLDRAVSLGVAVNELVANAAEHAFDDGQNGTITIRLTPADPHTGNRATLIVADDGRGLGKARDGSSGLELVRGLVRRARGRVELVAGEGTIWRIALE